MRTPDTIPTDIWQNIMSLVALSDPLRPPSGIIPFILTDRYFHSILCLCNSQNAHIYHHIFLQTFDIQAPRNHLGRGLTTASCCAEELRERLGSIQRIRHRANFTPLSEVLTQDLCRCYFMLIENDGRNMKWLIDYARLPEFIYGFMQTCINNHLDAIMKPSPLWAFLIWSLWLLTTEEMLLTENNHITETIQRCLLPCIITAWLFHDYPPECSVASSDPVLLQSHPVTLRYKLRLFSHMMEFNLPKATPAAILAFSIRADAYLLKLGTSTTLSPGHTIAEEALERARRLLACSLRHINKTEGVNEWEKLEMDCKMSNFSSPAIDICNLLYLTAGIWEGRLEYPNHSQYMALRGPDVGLDMYDNLFLTSLPVLCCFQVFYYTKDQEPLRQATEPDAILNAWLPPDSEIDIMITKDGGLRIYDRILQRHVSYQRYCGKEGLPISSETIIDILIMGTTLSTNIGLDARYFGRVRLSDGLLIIVRDGPQIGREILRGYIHHNTNLVGRWRTTAPPANVVNWEGPFVLVRVGGE